MPASPLQRPQRTLDGRDVAGEAVLLDDLPVEAVERDGILRIAFASAATRRKRVTESVSYFRSLAVDPLLSISTATENG